MATLRHGPVRTFASTVFSYAEILSIDICIGVVGSGALAASLLHAEMRLVWWFLLPAAVWVIYTADHLLDARKIGQDIVNARHKFHRKHFTVLTTVTVLMALGCLVAALIFLSDIVLKGGLLLCILAAFHLAMAFWGEDPVLAKRFPWPSSIPWGFGLRHTFAGDAPFRGFTLSGLVYLFSRLY